MPRSKHSISLCYGHTLPGLEPVAWLEVRRRLHSAQFKLDAYARNQYGLTLFSMTENIERLYELRTVDKVFLGLLWIPKLSRGRQDLRRVEDELLKRGDFGRAVNQYTRLQQRQVNSFHVVADKYGQHQYRLRDWSRMVRGVISRLYPQWTGTQDAADLTVWASLLGSQALIGLELPRPDDQDAEPHPADYPAILAAGLVELTEPTDNDLFLDPLSVDNGLVLAERWAAGNAVAIWGAQGLLGTSEMNSWPTETMHQWLDGQLPVGPGTVDKMATILPMGLGEEVILTLVHESARLLHPAGRFALFTHEYDRFLNLLRAEPRLQVSGGHSVLVNGQWGRVYVIEHNPA